MKRTVVGFHQDDVGDWVAELGCLHSQHVRHRPPFWDRPWVLSGSGRAGRVGTDLNCPLCDRAELPEGLVVVRTAGPFDAETLPAGLRREHRVGAGTWGNVRVLEGSILLDLATEPRITARLGAGERQALPPGVAHSLTLDGPVRLAIDFLVRGGDPDGEAVELAT